MISTITRPRLWIVPALVAGASFAPAAAQDVEIISGIEAPTARLGAAPGIRVIAFIRFEPAATTYRVVEPVLAPEILAVQAALANAGHEPGARDGIVGPATAAALTAFQSDLGLDPCGCVDYATAMALGLQRRVVQTVVGSPEDEPSTEIVMPEGRLGPRPAVPTAPPPGDTVTIVRTTQGAWWGSGFGGVAILGMPLPPLPGDGTGAARVPPGVPFGGTATRGRATIRTIPPPRR